MKTFSILSLFLFFISCGKNSSTQEVLGKTFNPTESENPDKSTCETLASIKVIIDDLNWHEFSDARNLQEYKNSKTVGQLIIPKSSARCTAFIINSNTIMTNNHCVGSASQALNVTFKIRDTDSPVKTYKCSKFIMTSTTLDYTLLECEDNLGLIHGHSTLSSTPITLAEEIYVIQENCDYVSNPYCTVNKMIAIGALEQIGNYVIGHNADTLGGSSGSPIYLSSTNKVIGLHNAGRSASGSVSARNFGIPITKIVEDVEKRLPSMKIYKDEEGSEQDNNDNPCE